MMRPVHSDGNIDVTENAAGLGGLQEIGGELRASPAWRGKLRSIVWRANG